MQKLRIKFSKEGGASYISHLDLMRTLERSLRRADLSLAFSEGFNPHPKMSFASALSLGVKSRGEYLDLELEKPIDKEEVLTRLNGVLPEGIRALAVEELKNKEGAAMSLVAAATYEIEGKALWTEGQWQDNLAALLTQSEILVEREGKNGLREIDVAPFLIKAQLINLTGNDFTLTLTVRAGSAGNLRPQEVLQALEKYYGLTLDNVRILRTGLYREKEGHLIPLISSENEVIQLRS